jgi:hypothetical protein
LSAAAAHCLALLAAAALAGLLVVLAPLEVLQEAFFGNELLECA